MKKVYQALASAIGARLNCIASGNKEWESNHEDTILAIVNDGPSGAGIDCGTKIDLSRSTSEKLVLSCEYHHMNDAGYYDGWTEHKIVITPSLQFGIAIKIGGRDRNDIKEYLYEVYDCWLNEEMK
jgi:hypothetical protein